MSTTQWQFRNPDSQISHVDIEALKMSKRAFKSQASSSRADPASSFSGLGTVFAGSMLSYVSEPPNLSSITDANVVVAFRNLMKKDSTTKAKGLEDLRLFVQLHPYQQDGGVEQPILEAWVKLYPRISIDNSRRVRELSHNLQYELLRSARKRMEKHIPSIVGAWLAGIYDRDPPVSRAASDGVTSFLDSEEKVLSFWRRCQPQILEYAQESIKETPQTLSDERNVSADDAQAKYDRVIGASLSLVINLLAKLNDIDIKKQQESYERFLLGNKMLWSFIASKDAFLRRTSAQLLLVSLEKERNIVERDLEMISHAFLAEGLRSVQTSSALHFLQAVNQITQSFPQIWLGAYKGKKPLLSRLQNFIEKGSQGGPPEFWQLLYSLVMRLPLGVLPTGVDGTVDFLKTYRDGISGRNEVRSNMSAAWTSYFQTVKYFGSRLSDPKTFEDLLQTAVFPVFEQFLRPSSDRSSWSLGNSTSALAMAFGLCSIPGTNGFPKSLYDEWLRLADLLTANILTSLPEQPKDYFKSQAAVIVDAHCWFELQADIIRSAKSSDSRMPQDSIIAFLAVPCSNIIKRALEVIKIRNGKAYGAAGTIEAVLRITPDLVCLVPSIEDAIASFLQEDLPRLILSPSSENLIASLYAFRTIQDQNDRFEAIWQRAIDELLTTPDSAQKSVAIKGLISNHAASRLAQQDLSLQDYLSKSISQLLRGHHQDWPLFENSFTFEALNSETINSVISVIVDSLDVEADAVDPPLRALEFIIQRKPQDLHKGDMANLTIITRLLSLTESSTPGVVARASALKTQIERDQGGIVDKSQNSSPILDIIRENLETAGPQSLTINTLAKQAESFVGAKTSSISHKVFPNLALWSQALMPLLVGRPNAGLSLTSSLGPAISIIPLQASSQVFYPLRDINGYSVPFRMALYTSKLLGLNPRLDDIAVNDQVEFLRLLILTQLLASDQLGLGEQNMLWSSIAELDSESQITDFIESTQVNVTLALQNANDWRVADVEGSAAVAKKLIGKLVDASSGDSPLAFYSSRALSNVLIILVEKHGWKTLGSEEWLSSLNILKTSTNNVFAAVSVLSSLQEVVGTSKVVNNFCNRLLSDITVASIEDDKTLRLLLLLNATLSVYEPSNLPMSQNRVVFAVKHITEWIDKGRVPPFPLMAEAFRSFHLLLPSLKEIYGPHWEALIKFCVKLWNNETASKADDNQLAALNASVRLIAMLKELDPVNEDLSEALYESEQQLSDGLLQLLGLGRTTDNQPWRIFDELLWRQVTKTPPKLFKDPSILYPLVASEFYFVQLAAFDVLSRAISAAQEQISIDVLLDKRDARLPDELLSLLLSAPAWLDFSDEELARFPSSVRCYLFSWNLVFISYPKASYKVRTDYNNVLKSENYINPLLDFLFDALGHSAAQPLNLDKAGFTQQQIQFYEISLAKSETDERHMQWLLINLYYQCLSFAPGLAKDWWMNCKSKQTRVAVEAWTEKYFSPLVIVGTLDEVVSWAAQQEPASEDEKELIIKASKNSREVFAGVEVDDMLLQIVIRLPVLYPLDGVKVAGINRVAVTEKKWQSWLMITQGVIQFSNGSVIDGLVAFRKNVTGTLKGQTECAICYSIISADKKTPDKRCQTCKNLFHSSCLFKWFASSNQSTCPLCRNPFNYGTGHAARARRRGGPE